MKSIVLVLAFALISGFTISAQEVFFSVNTTTDTLLLGNPMGVKYIIKNTQGDFEPPQFDGFDIVGGPNVSSQFSMNNGVVTQSSSYEYYLLPSGTGSFTIPSAVLINGEETLYSEEIEIIVLENPNDIRQNVNGYNVSKSVATKSKQEPMSKADSLKMKLRKIKARKI